MKNSVFWEMMTPSGCCKNRLFGGTYRFLLHCYRRELTKCYTVVLYGRLIITFDEAAAYQLYLHSNT
jgi:hypothetical protein